MACGYDSFTDRARKVMQLANQEAQRFNHEYIGTEHILLALLKEGCGVAANVIKDLGVDLRKIRLEIERHIKAGPDMVTMGKLPQTPSAKKVIEFTLEEAAKLHHNHVGTEHLLLGLIREQEGIAAIVLKSLGIAAENVRERVLGYVGIPSGPIREVVLRVDITEAVRAEANRIASEQLQQARKPSRTAHDRLKQMSLVSDAVQQFVNSKTTIGVLYDSLEMIFKE